MNASRLPLILVFDDDLVQHQGFFAPLPARFVYRPNADEALADVAGLRPDAVFMDHHMRARLDGVDAVRLLRTEYSLDALPIVAISSDSRCNTRMCVAGANEGVVKMAVPERFAELVAAGVIPTP